MLWTIIDTGRASAEKNMAIDKQLLRDLPATTAPILRLYTWQGACATHGYFLNPYTFLKRDAVNKHRLALARRPTGGGIVFHLADFTYSLLLPSSHPLFSRNTRNNYALVHQLVAEVVQQTMDEYRVIGEASLHLRVTNSVLATDCFHSENFCMANPTVFDVMWQGKKVGGGSQRRTRFGFLHQGTIALGGYKEEEDCLIKSVIVEEKVAEHMRERSACLFAGRDLQEIRDALAKRMKQIVSQI